MLILAGLIILTMGAIPWDLQLSLNARRIRIPGDLRRFIQLSEVFAHSLGCAAILGTLLWVDVRNRRKLLLAIGFVVLSAVVANAAKYIIPRHRPHTYGDLWPSSTWETFGSPFTKSWFDESVRSFPSGHTATAVAMAIGLSYVYPRGRFLFFSMAILASLQRLFSGAHFASDILSGLIVTFSLAIAWTWLASRRNSQSSLTDP